MSLALGTWTAAALLPLLLPGAVSALWIAALVGSAASATTFPVVESYLTAGRHGAEMRSAIGKFNLTWTPATALPLLLLPLFGPSRMLGSFAISAAASALALLAARALPLHPAPHGQEAAQAAVGPEYPALLRAASWLLPFSYVISATLAPVLPHRLAAVGVGASASFVAAIWMATRFGALLVMWRSSFWHGRWETVGAASAALVGGLALVLLATSLPILIAGLLVYGAGMGLTYYASLYYSMAIGHGAVDAGGNFEALIGVGLLRGAAPGDRRAGGGRPGAGRRGDGRADLALHRARRARRRSPLSGGPPQALTSADVARRSARADAFVPVVACSSQSSPFRSTCET